VRYRLRIVIVTILVLSTVLADSGMGGLAMSHPTQQRSGSDPVGQSITLPAPRLDSATSVERALHKRRSVREFKPEPLTLPEVAQLLWAAQGVTDPREGFRTAPSAGATYPLEVYLAAGRIQGLAAGVYRYQPSAHAVVRVHDGDVRQSLTDAALGQRWVGEGAAVLVLAAVYERTTQRYGDRGIRYVHMEVGHAAQNVYLQGVALGLGAVVVGAFHDGQVRRIIRMLQREVPLYIMPVGRT